MWKTSKTRKSLNPLARYFYKKQKSFNASVEEIKFTQLYCIKSLPWATKINNNKILTLSDTITKTGKELIRIIICHPLNIWQMILKIQPFLFPFIIRLKIKYSIIIWRMLNIWVKVFKNGPSKLCGKQPSKSLKWYGLPSTNFTCSIFEYFDQYFHLLHLNIS